MDTSNRSKPDEYEQSGAGLRDLLRRFKLANTADELLWIAAEAERRAKQLGLASLVDWVAERSHPAAGQIEEF